VNPSTTDQADALTTAEAAADRFLAVTWDALADKYTAAGFDFDAALSELLDALEDADATGPEGAIASVLAETWTRARAPFERPGVMLVATTTNHARYELRVMRAALDRALDPFDRADELAAAEQAVEAAEQEQRRLVAALTDAVERVDVDTVTRLRGEVEVGAPGRISQARLRVLELRIAEAEAAAERPTARHAKHTAAAERADADVDKARCRLQEAEDAAAVAVRDRDLAAQDQAAARSRADELRDQLEHARAADRVDQQARMRRLAGLPDPVPETTAVYA